MVSVPCPPGCTVKLADPALSEKSTRLKLAPTDSSAFMVRLHAPVPEQPPCQPAKKAPEAGEAVKLTVVPVAKPAWQVPGQFMPAGLLVTVPLAVPVLLMATWSCGIWLKVAVTCSSVVMSKAQEPVPVHAPLHPANADRLSGLAVNATLVPLGKLVKHRGAHDIPAGLLTAVPLPAPDSTSVKVGPVAGSIVVDTDAVSFEGSRSEPAVVTLVDVVSVPCTVGTTSIVSANPCPGCILLTLQVRILVPEQSWPETSSKPFDKSIVRVTEELTCGPRLVA
jgi:hypothetical protein